MLLKQIKKLKPNHVLAIAHQLLMAIYGFVLLLILYRVTSKEETGRWLMFTSAISLMDMVMHGFLQTPVIRKIALEKSNGEGINGIASNAFFFSMGIWAVLSVVVLTASVIFSGSQLMHDLRWYPLLGSFMVFYNLSWWIGNALSDFKSVLIQRLVYCVISMGMVAVCYYNFPVIQVQHIILSQVAGYAVSSMATFVFIRAIKISSKSFNPKQLTYFFNYGKFTSGSMIMGSLFRNVDIFMIAGLMGQGAVAVYSAAQKMVEIFEVALRGMASHALPEFCQCADNFELMMKKYMRITSMLLMMFLPFAIIMFFFSDWVIHLLSGTGYETASPVLRFFMIYVLFLVLDRMTGIVLEALGLAPYNLIKTVLLLIVNIIGNAVALLYFHSLAAVAAVSIIAAITGITVGFYFIANHNGVVLSQHKIRSSLNYFFK